MDVGRTERSGSVVQKKSTRTVQNLLRSPLVQSEKDNSAPPRTSKLLQPENVTSKHKSGISSTSSSLSKLSVSQQRFPSPRTLRVTPVPEEQLSKRSLSAERRRPSSPSSSLSATSLSLRPATTSSPSRPSTPVHDSVVEGNKSSRRSVGLRTGDGLWPSMRNLSSSFNSGSVLISSCKKKKEVTLNSDLKISRIVPFEKKKKTTVKGSNVTLQSENSKPVENSHTRVIDQHKRSCITNARLSPACMTRSLDLTDKVSRTSSLSSSLRRKSPTMRNSSSDASVKPFPKSTIDSTRRMSLDEIGRKELNMSSCLGFSSDYLKKATLLPRSCRSESLHSSVTQCPSTPSKSSLRPSSPCNTLRPASPCKTLRPASPCKTLRPASPCKTLRPASPCKTLSRPSSPNKAMFSQASSRPTASPSRSRPSTPSLSSSNSSPVRSCGPSSLINYIIDAQKGKMNGSHIENVHQLRLLYNRYMQWCFINARAETTSSTERTIAESVIYSVWLGTSELLDSVTMKKISLQQTKQVLKLYLILKEQMEYLEEWASLEREHFTLLSGAAKALKASIIRLPVTGRAKADVSTIKDSISSAVEIMQIMGSSICCLLSMVEGTNSLVSELASIAAKEYFMLDECRELLASTAAMQVQELSLRTHLLQLRNDAIAVD